jgi:alpha-L-fucosidase
MRAMFDGNGYTAYLMPKEKAEFTVKLSAPATVSGCRYTPSQRRDANDCIISYQLFIDNKKVSEGEFSNIVNNPVMQEIRFPEVKGQNIRFVAKRVADNSAVAGVGEFSVITE